jgi:hypothetical protein
MPLPEAEKERVGAVLDRYCDEKIPAQIRHQVRLTYRFDGNAIVLYEERPRFDHPSEWIELNVAKFRYFVGRRDWVLFWRDRNSKWHRYDLVPPSQQFEDLLREVEADPTCIFWG